MSSDQNELQVGIINRAKVLTNEQVLVLEALFERIKMKQVSYCPLGSGLTGDSQIYDLLQRCIQNVYKVHYPTGRVRDRDDTGELFHETVQCSTGRKRMSEVLRDCSDLLIFIDDKSKGLNHETKRLINLGRNTVREVMVIDPLGDVEQFISEGRC